MSDEPVPSSLNGLRQRLGRSAKVDRRRVPEPDAQGQFGLLFEPAPLAIDVAALTEETSSGRVTTVAVRVSEPAADVAHAMVVPVAAEPMVQSGALPGLRDGAPWTVASLVGTLRGQLENHGTFWVVGEISNMRPAASGHLYFTLKDGDAQISVVIFRRAAALIGKASSAEDAELPRWRPRDGEQVLLSGRLSVFEGRGQLQIIGETLELRGDGLLQRRLDALKEKLRLEGLFAPERKRPLPLFPRRVGVVTSVQGAVIRDIVTVCRRRHACLNLLVYPAAVQGPGAAAEVAAGIRYLNRATAEGTANAVDLIVVARGGGSAEDLQAFNDEGLARVIAASELPVVSAVGHETDVTIADLAADLRAPTPSAAAEMITESQHRVEERVQALTARLHRGVRFQQMSLRQRFTRLGAEGVLRRTRDGLDRRQQRVDAAAECLQRAAERTVQRQRERLRGLEARLERQDVRHQLVAAKASLSGGQDRLMRFGAGLTGARRGRVEQLSARLMALSPLAVLERGYSLTFTEDGRLVRSAADVAAGDVLRTRFAEGSAVARVEGVEG